jgi:hypothetical protein
MASGKVGRQHFANIRAQGFRLSRNVVELRGIFFVKATLTGR